MVIFFLKDFFEGKNMVLRLFGIIRICKSFWIFNGCLLNNISWNIFLWMGLFLGFRGCKGVLFYNEFWYLRKKCGLFVLLMVWLSCFCI